MSWWIQKISAACFPNFDPIEDPSPKKFSVLKLGFDLQFPVIKLRIVLIKLFLPISGLQSLRFGSVSNFCSRQMATKQDGRLPPGCWAAYHFWKKRLWREWKQTILSVKNTLPWSIFSKIPTFKCYWFIPRNLQTKAETTQLINNNFLYDSTANLPALEIWNKIKFYYQQAHLFFRKRPKVWTVWEILLVQSPSEANSLEIGPANLRSETSTNMPMWRESDWQALREKKVPFDRKILLSFYKYCMAKQYKGTWVFENTLKLTHLKKHMHTNDIIAVTADPINKTRRNNELHRHMKKP